MDPSLEESARIHGASTATALRLVTLPLVLPAILGSALLVFVQACGPVQRARCAGNAQRLLRRGTEIYRLLNFPPRVSQAAARGLLPLLVTAALIWAQSTFLGRRSYVTVTGKAFRPRTLEIGWPRYGLALLAWLYVAAGGAAAGGDTSSGQRWSTSSQPTSS